MSGERVVLGEPDYVWKDHSRFVEVCLVQTGWLVVWGRYEELGRRRLIAGHQVYRDLPGVRRRLAAAVLDLTRKSAHVHDALALFDRQPPADHAPTVLPEPL